MINQLLTMSAQLGTLIEDCARSSGIVSVGRFEPGPAGPAAPQKHSFIPEGVEARMYEMADHMMKMLMSIMAALSLGSLLFLIAVL
ncbi:MULTISPECIES: hypothetical protein [unclassified Ensifer]|uniref:hypothetical protein n=1 Tax=unclassified Ensifer TaxID=2633371 RepID=UPI0011476BF6|nr:MULTISPECIES: hypothetical protein [unclassified Ensifer]